MQHASSAPKLRWLSGRDSGLIAIVFDGKVRLHTVKSNHHEKDKRTAVYLTASKRPITELSLNATDVAALGWHLNKTNATQRVPTGRPKQFSASIVQDKDTSPMSLPFHRTTHVDLFTFEDAGPPEANSTKLPNSASQGTGSQEAWVFGLSLSPTTKITSQQSDSRDGFGQALIDGEVDDLFVGTHEPDSRYLESSIHY